MAPFTVRQKSINANNEVLNILFKKQWRSKAGVKAILKTQQERGKSAEIQLICLNELEKHF